MRIAACEIVKACTEGATERAFFWVKWLLEEDGLIRKNNMGVGLTTIERGPATLPAKRRTDQGYFLLAVFAEVYKDLAARQAVRMHEEFQALLDIWRSTEIPLTMKQRRELLGIIVLLVAEVPRWKVPAAPPLVKDPVSMSRAVNQSSKFFSEILIHQPISRVALKEGAKRKPSKKINDAAKKQMTLEEHLAAYDKVVNSYLGIDI
jgi:hypothetical protein